MDSFRANMPSSGALTARATTTTAMTSKPSTSATVTSAQGATSSNSNSTAASGSGSLKKKNVKIVPSRFMQGITQPKTTAASSLSSSTSSSTDPRHSSGVGTFRKNPYLASSSSSTSSATPRLHQAVDDVRTKSQTLRASLTATEKKRAIATHSQTPREVWGAKEVDQIVTSTRKGKEDTSSHLSSSTTAPPQSSSSSSLHVTPARPSTSPSSSPSSSSAKVAESRMMTLEDLANETPRMQRPSTAGSNVTAAAPSQSPSSPSLFTLPTNWRSFTGHEAAIAVASNLVAPSSKLTPSRSAWEANARTQQPPATSSFPHASTQSSPSLSSSPSETVTTYDDVTLTQHPYPSSEHLKPYDPAYYEAEQRALAESVLRARMELETEQAREEARQVELAKIQAMDELAKSSHLPFDWTIPESASKRPRPPTLGPQHPLPRAGEVVELPAPLEVDVQPFVPMEVAKRRIQTKVSGASLNAGMIHDDFIDSQSHASSLQPPMPSGDVFKLSRDRQEELYHQYQTLLLQWCFLNARTQSSFEMQQVKALTDIHAVVMELQRLREELSIKLLQHERKQHFRKLDHILDEQSQVFDRLMPILAAFEAQYSQLAEALHIARHRVGLIEIDMNTGSASVSASLNVGHRQLQRTKELIQPYLEMFQSLQATSTGLASTLSNELSEMTELFTLTRRAYELEQHERGLRMEDMQRNKVADMMKQIILQPDQLQTKAMFKY